MPDVVIPGRSEADLFRSQAADMDHMAQHRNDEPWTGHPPMSKSHALRVGIMGMSAQCQECGTICMANHELGAFVGPPGDPWGHAFPWRKAVMVPEAAGATEANASVGPSPTFASDRPRPAGLPAGLPRRTKYTPSRDREHRKMERRRERARKRGLPITPDMFASTESYRRWRRNYPHEAASIIEPPKPEKVRRLRLSTPRPKPVDPDEPYIETVPDWDDDNADDNAELSEAEASLAKLRATPDPGEE